MYCETQCKLVTLYGYTRVLLCANVFFYIDYCDYNKTKKFNLSCYANKNFKKNYKKLNLFNLFSRYYLFIKLLFSLYTQVYNWITKILVLITV